MQSIASNYSQAEVTPTVTAAAYSANNQVGGIQTLTGVCFDENRFGQLSSITLIDKAAQSAAMSIFFFDQLPTVASTDKNALDITDAEMASKCIGQVTIAAGDYQSTSSNSVACKTFSLPLKSRAVGTPGGTLYVVVKTTGTPTYASTSDLVFKYTFVRAF
jgi:hypothetical protein